MKRARARRTRVLESWEYRNPEEVFEHKRGELCIGCTHAIERSDGLSGTKMVCRKGKKYGTRCAKFKEKEDD